ncbi:HlyD family secretion protein [Methylobacter tundripaludum]|uniref:HlyD family secretion protein n=1 Tax=Methylobacter tundripaludum TaxID=173365 RepID=UPI000691746F|nr:HlyD family secretion protein [Methylobacter tundripaludum]
MINKLKTDYRIWAGIIVIIFCSLLAGWQNINFDKESTDNAIVRCDVVDVTSQVSGIIQSVHFHDNQLVNVDDDLINIDPDLYRARLDRAEARLNIAELSYSAALKDELLSEINAKSDFERSKDSLDAALANLEAIKSQMDEAKASSRSAKVDLKLAEANYQRVLSIFQKGMTSKASFDNAESNMDSKKALLAASQANVEAQENQFGAEKARVAEIRKRSNVYGQSEGSLISKAQANTEISSGNVKVARAERDLAALDYSRTKIKAFRSGIITNRKVALGHYVEANQPIGSIVTCTEKAWIEANYKETQVGRMKPGQPVKFTVDAYPDVEFLGEVESISGGSGAIFSLLPPENATGNFTKVVQRIPVLIKIDQEQNVKMRVGMSVVATVITE